MKTTMIVVTVYPDSEQHLDATEVPSHSEILAVVKSVPEIDNAREDGGDMTAIGLVQHIQNDQRPSVSPVIRTPANLSSTGAETVGREDNRTSASGSNSKLPTSTEGSDLQQHELGAGTSYGFSWKPILMIGCLVMLIILRAVYYCIRVHRNVDGHNSLTGDFD